MLPAEINLAYCRDFMETMRRAIAAGRFGDFCAQTKEERSMFAATYPIGD